MRERLRAALAFAGCAGGLALLLAPSAACVPHSCDATTTTFELGKPGQPSWTDTEGFTVLTSGPIEGPWVAYPGNVTIDVVVPPGFQIVQWPPSVSVSTGQDQDAGATSTTASGQLDQFTDISNTSFKLNNGSCADYYVWFSVVGVFTTAGDAAAD